MPTSCNPTQSCALGDHAHTKWWMFGLPLPFYLCPISSPLFIVFIQVDYIDTSVVLLIHLYMLGFPFKSGQHIYEMLNVSMCECVYSGFIYILSLLPFFPPLPPFLPPPLSLSAYFLSLSLCNFLP